LCGKITGECGIKMGLKFFSVFFRPLFLRFFSDFFLGAWFLVSLGRLLFWGGDTYSLGRRADSFERWGRRMVRGWTLGSGGLAFGVLIGSGIFDAGLMWAGFE
jgi:hypothetical protein